ncbi:MAG: phosphoribosylamine--glycine ligase, partial [Blastocatellia bacterium]|nr:phosphoribosylamine--glycine ligase [Blastocatellia bacterium]
SAAIEAVREMSSLVGSEAAAKIVIEECLVGKEVSLLMFADGADFVLMPPTRDHKRIGEGDTGPNTGGMGTITDSPLLGHDEIEIITDQIVEPTLVGCIADGFPFRGILFLGLMMTADGPKNLEYNVRFGDPETQAILVRLETDLVDICESMLSGTLSSIDIEWKQGSSACVVLAAKNYPGKPVTGEIIKGLTEAEMIEGVKIFHAGTARGKSGELITAGGRVLGVTATCENLDAALLAAYEAAAKISFDGMQFRRDIGK